MLLRCLGWRKRKRDDHTLAYADVLAQRYSESVEANAGLCLRDSWHVWGRSVCHTQRMMFGELVWGKGYSGGQGKDWMDHLKEDMSVFGIKFEGWREVAQKAGRRFRRVEEGAELFMRNWHETERRKAEERREKAASAPSTVGISKRPGGGGMGRGGEGTGGGEREWEKGRTGGRGRAMPKRMKPGFGHHRLESCGPSNGRHKLA